MKKFFTEFKTFITRGNVVDMAVGVIVGGAFTAIVNGMSNFILKPFTNYLLALVLGAKDLSECYTMLKPAYVINEAGVATSELDLANSIYIDWGSFINSIINFILVAFVLFVIVKIIHKARAEHKEFNDNVAKIKLSKEQKKEIKAAGIKRRDREAVKAYFAEKKRLADEAAAAEAEAAAAAERAANPTTEDLLKLILAELQNK